MKKVRATVSSFLSVAFLFLHLFFLTAFVAHNQGYNWDFLPYVALTFSDEYDNSVVHKKSYGILRDRFTEQQYASIIGGSPEVAELYENPDFFEAHLKMFQIKPLYVSTIKLLVNSGLDPIESILLVSLIPGILICLIAYLWFRDLTGPWFSLCLTVVFSLASRLFDISRVAFPDALASLMILTGTWLILHKKLIPAGSSILMLSIWVRTSNILFVAPMMMLFCWNYFFRSQIGHETGLKLVEIFTLKKIKMMFLHTNFRWCLSSLVFSILSYFWINYRYEYDWWLLFYHTFIDYQVDLAGFDIPFSFSLYLGVVKDAFIQFFTITPDISSFSTSRVPLFMLIGIAAWFSNWRMNTSSVLRPTNDVCLADAALLCFPVFLVFMFLFPQTLFLDRFFIAYYAILIVFAVSRHGPKSISA